MSNSIIYQPQGKALEYCDLAANLYKGCVHGCTYCYVPIFTKRDREDFHKNVTPRKDVIEKLQKEVSNNGVREEVLFSFTTDPYQPIDKELQLTRKAIEILINNGISVNVLTKAGMNSIRDFDLLRRNGGRVPDRPGYPYGHKYGATLTFFDTNDSLRYEPFAAKPASRLAALAIAKAKGIYTWVSLEPVIDPVQTIELVERTVGIVDEYRVGKWNYDRRAHYIDWHKFLKDIIKVFKRHGKKYYIKNDLQVFMERR